ncbi:GIP [Symbiodinium microadriaticum]|nr:GIP [Symbiodinium microadriaticum]
MKNVYTRYKAVLERLEGRNREQTEGLPEGPQREAIWQECHAISAVELKRHAEVYRTIQRTFHQAPKDIFCEFDPEPLASASIAQVHRARLRKKIVAVKSIGDFYDLVRLPVHRGGDLASGSLVGHFVLICFYLFAFPVHLLLPMAVPNPAEIPCPIDVDAGEALGSPTELAEDSEMEVDLTRVKSEELDGSVGAHQAKLEKRKRRNHEEDASGLRAAQGDQGEGEESPSKRPHAPAAPARPEDRPVTGGELRQLLQLHAREMKEAWQSVEGRLERVEHMQHNQKGDIASLAGRVKINERDIMGVKRNQDVLQPRLDALTEDVKNLKVHLDEVKQQQQQGASRGGERASGSDAPTDPWAEFLRNKQQGVGGNGSYGPQRKNQARHNPVDVVRGAQPPQEGGDFLSEEDQRTLIIGGWAQDTRKATIEAEAAAILELPEVQSLLDVNKISVFGPRRSVGMIKFIQREGEDTFAATRERMWKVVRAVAAAKVKFPSTVSLGEDRTAWASFMKTKTARARTAHISMARRVTMGLAADVKDEGGGVLRVENTLQTSYDMDWNAGTIWCGPQKLASATHRQPRDQECIVMTGGWISLSAVSLVAGCSVDVAKAAFELEL